MPEESLDGGGLTERVMLASKPPAGEIFKCEGCVRESQWGEAWGRGGEMMHLLW